MNNNMKPCQVSICLRGHCPHSSDVHSGACQARFTLKWSYFHNLVHCLLVLPHAEPLMQRHLRHSAVGDLINPNPNPTASFAGLCVGGCFDRNHEPVTPTSASDEASLRPLTLPHYPLQQLRVRRRRIRETKPPTELWPLKLVPVARSVQNERTPDPPCDR